MTTSSSSVFRILIFVIIVYVSIGFLAFIFQTSLIFFPSALDKEYKFTPSKNAEEVFLRTEDGETINGLYFPGKRSDVILYFHGNAGDLSTWQGIAADFTDFGFSFLIIDFRGYGKSSGRISESGFYRDADGAFKYLTEVKGFSSDQVIVYGRSIGSGVATDLASRYPVKGLILEAPYSSLRALAQERVPLLLPKYWLSYSFDNLSKIQKLKAPVLIIHGDADAVIPFHHSAELFDACHSKKKLVVIPGGPHNNLNVYPQYFEAISLAAEDFFDS